eukprot:3941549-Rhodomonas_salina.1
MGGATRGRGASTLWFRKEAVSHCTPLCQCQTAPPHVRCPARALSRTCAVPHVRCPAVSVPHTSWSSRTAYRRCVSTGQGYVSTGHDYARTGHNYVSTGHRYVSTGHRYDGTGHRYVGTGHRVARYLLGTEHVRALPLTLLPRLVAEYPTSVPDMA